MAEVLARPYGTETSHTVTSERTARWVVDAFTTPTSDSVIDAHWRQRRQHNRHEERLLRRGHQDHYGERLAQARAAHSRRDPAQLLTDLSCTWGMTWVDIARIVGVSVPAIRKWRISASNASPENQSRLAALVGFLEVLNEVLGGAAPASWLALPLVERYSVTPRHILDETTAAALLDYAAGNITAVDLLDRIDANWRSTYRSEYEVFTADDGNPALRRREDAHADAHS